MAKQISKLGIMNAMGDAAHKKAQKMGMPKEGSPDEEASESPAQEVAEQKGKKPLSPKSKQMAAMKAKGK